MLELLKSWRQTTQFSGDNDSAFASPVKLGRLPVSYPWVWKVCQRAGTPKGHLAQPLREGFPIALGGIFDLLQLFGTKSGGDGFGTQTRSRCIGSRRWRSVGSAHNKPLGRKKGRHSSISRIERRVFDGK